MRCQTYNHFASRGAKHHHLATRKLHCLMTEKHMCEQLAQNRCVTLNGRRTRDLLNSSQVSYPLHCRACAKTPTLLSGLTWDKPRKNCRRKNRSRVRVRNTDIVFLVLSIMAGDPLQPRHRLTMRVVSDTRARDDKVPVTTNVPHQHFACVWLYTSNSTSIDNHISIRWHY